MLLFSSIHLLIPEVRAATLIVCPAGPHTTVQAAIDSANPGDTINVWSGTYNERVTINKSITLKGNGSTETIIDGQALGDAIQIKAPNVTISGFMIRNSSETDSGIFICGNSGYSVESCIIENNNLTENNIGLKIQNACNNIITQNTFLNNPIGISLIESYQNTIDKSRIMLTY